MEESNSLETILGKNILGGDCSPVAELDPHTILQEILMQTILAVHNDIRFCDPFSLSTY